MNPAYQRRKRLIAAAAMPLLAGLRPLSAWAAVSFTSLSTVKTIVRGRMCWQKQRGWRWRH